MIMILSLRYCKNCSVFIDWPMDRSLFCPFCGHQLEKMPDRKPLQDAFYIYGSDLDNKATYVRVIPGPDGNDSYGVIGDVERLKHAEKGYM